MHIHFFGRTPEIGHRRARVFGPIMLGITSPHFPADLGVGGVPKARKVARDLKGTVCGGKKPERQRYAAETGTFGQTEYLLDTRLDGRRAILVVDGAIDPVGSVMDSGTSDSNLARDFPRNPWKADTRPAAFTACPPVSFAYGDSHSLALLASPHPKDRSGLPRVVRRRKIAFVPEVFASARSTAESPIPALHEHLERIGDTFGVQREGTLCEGQPPHAPDKNPFGYQTLPADFRRLLAAKAIAPSTSS